jgi:hypothetical protein
MFSSPKKVFILVRNLYSSVTFDNHGQSELTLDADISGRHKQMGERRRKAALQDLLENASEIIGEHDDKQ